MRALPDAWSPPGPKWVTLAPGVKWHLRRPDGGQSAMVAAEVATVVARVYEGRAALAELGLDDDDATEGGFDLEKLTGYSSVLAACLHAQRCLLGWEGMDHPETGEALDHTDPENIRAALLHGAPPEGQPLLTPFLAWLEGPRRPMVAEAVRLRALAEDHWTGGAERCNACALAGDACAKGQAVEGEVCPRLKNTPQTTEGVTAWDIAKSTAGLWHRAGMAGAIVGLDYRTALLAFENAMPGDHFGAGFMAFQAIEIGRLKAEEAKAEKAPPHG